MELESESVNFLNDSLKTIMPSNTLLSLCPDLAIMCDACFRSISVHYAVSISNMEGERDLIEDALERDRFTVLCSVAMSSQYARSPR